MKIGVPKESVLHEQRVALVPATVGQLVKLGAELLVEAGAGAGARFDDEAYRAAGARVTEQAAEAYGGTDLLLKVQRPSAQEAAMLKQGGALVGLLQPSGSADLLAALAQREVTALAMELLPRITAAQPMDVLSSQATVAGYKAVLVGAAALGRMMPMMITAAGTLIPAKVFVVGAGVAGLQAIATARRLGGVVSAFDVRAAAGDEIRSLGGRFVDPSQVVPDAQTAGGYARPLTEEEQQKVVALIGRHAGEADLIITTAQVPGRPAPKLISAEAVAAMKPGTVIVDLAAEAGGNCELTRPGETVETGGVTIIGAVNLPATVATHASQMYSRNMLSLVQHVMKNGDLALDLEDRITGPMMVTYRGEVRYPR